MLLVTKLVFHQDVGKAKRHTARCANGSSRNKYPSDKNVADPMQCDSNLHRPDKLQDRPHTQKDVSKACSILRVNNSPCQGIQKSLKKTAKNICAYIFVKQKFTM
jgi:hypothetical protein